jgi:hypothetical protein
MDFLNRVLSEAKEVGLKYNMQYLLEKRG